MEKTEQFEIHPFDQLTLNEQDDFCLAVGNWLNHYVDEIIINIIPKIRDIYADELSRRLITELYNREHKELVEFADDISFHVRHNIDVTTVRTENVTAHSKSYRDVLYDIYIKDIKINRKD